MAGSLRQPRSDGCLDSALKSVQDAASGLAARKNLFTGGISSSEPPPETLCGLRGREFWRRSACLGLQKPSLLDAVVAPPDDSEFSG